MFQLSDDQAKILITDLGYNNLNDIRRIKQFGGGILLRNGSVISFRTFKCQTGLFLVGYDATDKDVSECLNYLGLE